MTRKIITGLMIALPRSFCVIEIFLPPLKIKSESELNLPWVERYGRPPERGRSNRIVRH
jgi:hypothetical protein